ncbi:ATP-binding protein [Kitasatospora sp. NPDC002227]|uniref:sensor histidine kinase n=1 Tax=Kitasatospora sp. NPDC002227 TaxID=3154773 RepID=UPI00332814AC
MTRQLLSPRPTVSAATALHERRNALHTLAGLLELARYAEGRHECAAPAPEVEGLLAQVDEPLVQAQLLGKMLLGVERGVRVRLGQESELRGELAHPGELVTILGNLIDNAVDAVAGQGAPEPVVEVTLRRDGAAVTLRVADNGPGVPPQSRERIFTAGWSSKRSFDGRHRGLGLALVRELAEYRGGRAEVSERRGGGAEFTVVLPDGPAGSAW